MNLQIIGSGSKGNMYVLTAKNGDNIIIEAGFTIKEITRALNFNFQNTLFALCTHAHGDHAKGIRDLQKAGIDVVMSQGTADRIDAIDYRHIAIKNGQKFKRGDFEVWAFDVKHDCPGKEPLGFLIKHPESGLTLFLTDTNYSDLTFPGLNNLLIEANFCENIMEERFERGALRAALKDRIFKEHMSLSTCLEVLKANDLSAVNNICLIHLSDSNSHAERFKQTVYDATLKNVSIALPGLNMPWNLTPFDFLED